VVLLTSAVCSVQASEVLQCPVGKPIASWDFNAGDSPLSSQGHVQWVNDHGGIVPVEGTELKGILFGYKGKPISKDSSSEWRYEIKTPLAQSWEYLRILQPTNFHLRYAVRVDAPIPLDSDLWRQGDDILTSKGLKGKVAQAEGNHLYIQNITARFDRNWGKGITIYNKATGAEFVSKDSRHVANNNKLSTQWQGRYSNAAMTVEFSAKLPSKGGDNGMGYFTPKVNTSKAHRASGTIDNQLQKMPGVAFDKRDNGSVVEFVIQRSRSSAEDVRDGAYRIWKRTESSTWTLVHENSSLYVWQPDNYFDHGYVFGWANSGYEEDTNFYLLGWQLWAEKPTFLP